MRFFRFLSVVSCLFSVMFLIIGEPYNFLWMGLLSIIFLIIDFFLKEKEEKQNKIILENYEREKQNKNMETISKYNDFILSYDFTIGMTVDEVKSFYKNITPKIEVKKSDTVNKVCPTCGAVMKNGICPYCGNKQQDDSNALTLYYDFMYGQKIYEFKNGILSSMKINAKPLEDFLIK